MARQLPIADLRPLKPAPKGRAPIYGTAEHRAWRDAVIARAGGRCQWPGCDRSLRDGRLFADHICELSDGGAPYDPANGQALCGAHHSLKTAQARAARAMDQRGASHPEWLRPSRIPLTVVCGPPAAGKSRLIAGLANPGDLVIELDRIAAQLSGHHGPDWDRSRWLGPALRQRNALLGDLAHPRPPWPAAWLSLGEPEAHWRQWWVDRLQPRQVLVLATPAALCRMRIERDPARAARALDQRAAVDDWWARYQPRLGDQVVAPHHP